MITVKEAYRTCLHYAYVPGIAYNDGVEETPIWNLYPIDGEHFQIELVNDETVIVPGSDLLAEFDANYYPEDEIDSAQEAR
jgi:hypothetical protein